MWIIGGALSGPVRFTMRFLALPVQRSRPIVATAKSLVPAMTPAITDAGGSAPSRAARRRQLILHGPVLVTLLHLAAPNLVVILAQAAANFLESYYVGLIGLDALAGAALVFPLVMLMQTMSGGGVGGAIASAVARALGSGQTEKAEALALHAVVIALVLGSLFTVAALFGGAALYQAMGGRGGALAAALTYSNVIFAGAVFLWLLNAFASILRGSGNMILPAIVLVSGTVMLFGISPALIFGWGPIPALGIAGAGAALVLYYAAGSAVLLVSLLRGRRGLRLGLHHRLRLSLFAEILGVGVLGAANNLLTNLSVVLATGLVGRFGTSNLAGFGLGIRLEYLQIPLVFGIGSGVVAMVGMNVGAGHMARARHIAWTGAMLAISITETVGVLAAIFPQAWVGLFTADPDAIRVGSSYLRVVGPFYGCLGAGLALYFASQGAGRMKWATMAALARVAVIAIGGALGMNAGTGLTPVFIVLILAYISFAAINGLNWRRVHGGG